MSNELWDEVVRKTKDHNLAEVRVHLDEGQSWTYYQCSCYPSSDTFREPWEFTDHIRRIVFNVVEPGAFPTQEAAKRMQEAVG